jgi:hypothetical protein
MLTAQAVIEEARSSTTKGDSAKPWRERHWRNVDVVHEVVPQPVDAK